MRYLAVISPTFPCSKLLAFKVSLKSLHLPSTSSNPISPTWKFLAPKRSMVVSTKKPGSHFKHLRKKLQIYDRCRVKNGEKVVKKWMVQDLWTNDRSCIPFDLDPEISNALLKFYPLRIVGAPSGFLNFKILGKKARNIFPWPGKTGLYPHGAGTPMTHRALIRSY